MNQFIFKSRWIAIAFTVLTLFSTYMLVGGEDDGSVLGNMQGAVVDQRDDTVAQLSEIGSLEGAPPPAPEAMDDAEFVEDDELVDPGEGTDPSPESGDGGDYGEGYQDAGDGPQFAPQINVEDGGDGDYSGD